jgi:transglutaminase-like putative cysteine protease
VTRDRWAPVLAAVATLLACWSLTAAVDGSSWQGPALLVVLVVLVAGVLARAARVPRVAVAPVQALAGLVALTGVYAGDVAVLGLLPGPAAVHRFDVLLIDGGGAINRYSAPVPISQGLSMVVVLGVLGVALAVDLCAVTLRAPAAAGLPLMALYSVPAAVVVGGLSWRFFAATALGWLLLLAHDASSRVLGWGRLLPRWGSAPASRASISSDTSALASTGRRLAVGSVLVAIAVPALVPGLADGLLTRVSSGSGADERAIGLTVVNPVLTLRDSLRPRADVEVLRYQTRQSDVAPLRIVTADVFDGATWAPGTRDVSRSQLASRGLPDPPGLGGGIATDTYTMRVQVGGTLNQDFLPLPYPAQKVDISGAWLYDSTTLNVIGDGETTRNQDYGVTYLAVRPTADQLRSAPVVRDGSLARWTSLPSGLPAVVAETARRVTAGAGTDYDKAMALQEWFRSAGGFVYSTDAPADSGGDAVAGFLSDRKGFCVQFSSAMAVMARSLGIPARIGVGFLPGTSQPDNWYSVKLTDAHAWPELYFSGVGWVRFEPTPASRTGAAPVYAQRSSATAPTGGPSGAATSTAGPSSSSSLDPKVKALQNGLEGAAPGSTKALAPLVGAGSGGPRLATVLKVVGVALLGGLLVLLTPLVAVVGRRRRRRSARDDADRVEVAWAELHERVRDLGVPLDGGLTPRQLDHRLAGAVLLEAAPRAALARLAGTVERSRYAAPGSPTPAVDDDLAQVLQAVAGTRSRSERVRAVVLPASGRERVARALGRATATIGGWDQRMARGSARVRRLRVHRRR